MSEASPGGRGEQGRLHWTPADVLSAMRIPLLRGRFLDATDGANAPRVAVVSVSFAKIAFGDANSSALVTLPERDDYKYVVMPMRI